MKREERELSLMLLRKAVEEKSGLRIQTSKDFETLAEEITDSRAGYVSASTLKRLWGYVKDTPGKHISTLNVLARYAGYARGYSEFEASMNMKNEVESGYERKRVLDVLNLKPESLVEVRWFPDREIVLRSRGGILFEVVKSVNSKLNAGMKVRCARIVEGEPVIFDIPDEDGNLKLNFKGGKIKGVTWRLL